MHRKVKSWHHSHGYTQMLSWLTAEVGPKKTADWIPDLSPGRQE